MEELSGEPWEKRDLMILREPIERSGYRPHDLAEYYGTYGLQGDNRRCEAILDACRPRASLEGSTVLRTSQRYHGLRPGLSRNIMGLSWRVIASLGRGFVDWSDTGVQVMDFAWPGFRG